MVDVPPAQPPWPTRGAALGEIAELLRRRNQIDQQIAPVVGRPMTAGHLGECIAAAVFDIELEQSAVNAAYDGRFRSGPLRGRTVNVKWYLKREGLLDMAIGEPPDYYLAMTGPVVAAASSRGATRPWCIDAVYLFEAAGLHADLRQRNRKIGIASSVRKAAWEAAEIYPNASPTLPLSADQRRLLDPCGRSAIVPDQPHRQRS